MQISVLEYPAGRAGQSIIDAYVEQVAQLRAEGFTRMWSVQMPFERDLLTAMAVAFREVDGIELGTGVLPIQNQHPMLLAYSVDEGAVHAAEVLDLEATLRLGIERGRLMAASATGGMLAVKDLAIESIEKVLSECQDGIVVAANYNSPLQLVISGEFAALNSVASKLIAIGGTCVQLNVQGAWHSPLVANAAKAFCETIDQVTFRAPQCKLVMGMTAEFEENPDRIRELLKTQICSPVRWFSVVRKIASTGISHYIEVGPGKVLRGLMRKILDDASSYEFVGADNSRFLKEIAHSGVHPQC